MAGRQWNDHPETTPGEIFISNYPKDKVQELTWKGIRVGRHAYGRDGSIIINSGFGNLVPVFAPIGEYEKWAHENYVREVEMKESKVTTNVIKSGQNVIPRMMMIEVD